jgi:dipeptidase E
MFDRLSNHAKKVLSQSRLCALGLRHDYIGPEHLLLGLLQVEGCTAVRVLEHMQVDCDALRQRVLTEAKPGNEAVTMTHLPFTPTAKRVLETSLGMASQLVHNYIGTEHLLLALCTGPTDGEHSEIAAKALAAAGLDQAAVRATIVELLAAAPEPAQSTLARRLLLISNSTMHGGGYLEHCSAEIRDFLGSKKRVLFVPYALANHEEYTAKARTAFAAIGHEVTGAHEHKSPAAAVTTADAIFVGGGNTFRLLKALYDKHMIQPIQKRAFAGAPYIGSSAGTNVATLSIRTTNDMPIVMPPSFTALQLVPFQINPHYLDPEPGSRHMGETREERLRQFHEEHDTPVLGLREGCMLRVEDDRMELRGTTRARLFLHSTPAKEYSPPCDLSFLLAEKKS